MKSASHPVVAAFDATTPTYTRFGIYVFSAIQPEAVSWAFNSVYARLVDGVRVASDSHEGVIAVERIISNAASPGTAMVRRQEPDICPRTAGFELHYMVLTWAKRLQVTVQNNC
jgi:hypothetical protein